MACRFYLFIKYIHNNVDINIFIIDRVYIINLIFESPISHRYTTTINMNMRTVENIGKIQRIEMKSIPHNIKIYGATEKQQTDKTKARYESSKLLSHSRTYSYV